MNLFCLLTKGIVPNLFRGVPLERATELFFLASCGKQIYLTACLTWRESIGILLLAYSARRARTVLSSCSLSARRRPAGLLIVWFSLVAADCSVGRGIMNYFSASLADIRLARYSSTASSCRSSRRRGT